MEVQADLDFEVNVKAEKEIEDIQNDLDEIKRLIQELKTERVHS